MKKRNLHSLSHYKLATMDMGKLIPVGLIDVLPGDSIQQATSALIRCSPLLAPVMHPISVRIHHFFVPNRLVFDDWESFITGGDDGEGDGSTFPQLAGANPGVGSVYDYMGVPTGVAQTVSALPLRAYRLIWNEYYRDKDLQTELNVTADNDLTVKDICWEKDYFTAARPWPQKGPEVTLPLGTSAPVDYDASGGLAPLLRTVAGVVSPGGAGAELRPAAITGALERADTGADLLLDPNGTLVADLAAATAVDVNTVRRAFALQRYQEARAMYGSEYVDYLRYAFGVTSSDARLQRPEYLGGGKQTIAFSEVLQTGPDSEDEGVASLKGHGIAAMRSRRYRRFFEEHGMIISLMSVRPKSMYATGVPRSFIKETKEDFYQHELEHIGQQEVLNREVYAAHASPSGTFGWQDRYAEYRHQPSSIAGEFRSTLNYWHLARIFSSDPALNSTFVTCEPGKRIHAEQSANQLWVMINHNIKARRQVGPPSPGRIF